MELASSFGSITEESRKVSADSISCILLTDKHCFGYCSNASHKLSVKDIVIFSSIEDGSISFIVCTLLFDMHRSVKCDLEFPAVIIEESKLDEIFLRFIGFVSQLDMIK